QSILRLENEFAILRGRMAGSTDAGRVIILPYHQIVNLAFSKRMLEPEVKSIFGECMPTLAGGAEQAPAGETASDTVADETPELEGENTVEPFPATPTAAAAGKGQAAPPS